MSGRAGMTLVATLSRPVEWFANRQPMIGSGVTGHYPPEVEVDIAELILKRLSTGGQKVRVK